MELRKEYDMLPEVKDYKTVRSNYERIQKGVELGTGAGDAAIVFRIHEDTRSTKRCP